MSLSDDLRALADQVRAFVDDEIPTADEWNVNGGIVDSGYRLIADGFDAVDADLAALDASAIVSGVFDLARIPPLDTAHLGDATVTDAKIVSLAYGKLTGVPGALPPSGPAGGDLTGTYPNPTVVKASTGLTIPVQNPALTMGGGAVKSRLAMGATNPPWTELSHNAALIGTQDDATRPSWKLRLGGTSDTADVGRQAPGSTSLVTRLSVLADGRVTIGANPTTALGVATKQYVDGLVPTTLPPSGPAGGDLADTYPNPTLRQQTVRGTPSAGATPREIMKASIWGADDLIDLSVTNAKIVNLDYAKLLNPPPALPPSGPAGGDLAGTYPDPTIKAGLIPTTLPPSGAAGGDLAGTYPNPTIGPARVTTAMLAPAVAGPVAGVFPAALSCTGLVISPRLSVIPSGTTADVYGNDAGSPLFDAAKPTWLARLDYGADVFSIWRQPPGGSYATLCTVDAAGNLFILGKLHGNSITDGSIWANTKISAQSLTAAQIYAGSTVNGFVSIPSYAGYLSAVNAWQEFSRATITTRGGLLYILWNPSMHVAGTNAVGYIQLILDGVQIFVRRYDFTFPSGIGKVPLAGVSTFAAAAAGTHTLVINYFVGTGGQFSTPADNPGGGWIIECA